MTETPQNPEAPGLALLPHQSRAVERLTRNRRFGLFDDQGLGKTAVALVAASRVVDLSACAPGSVLALVPTSVAWNWRRECQMWLGVEPDMVVAGARGDLRIRSPIVIATHGMFLSVRMKRLMETLPAKVLVVDESHNFKTPTAKRTLSLYGSTRRPGLVHRCEWVWAMTGTPMPNNPLELYTFLHALFPERLPKVRGTGLPWGYSYFRDQFFQVALTRYGKLVIGVKPERLQQLREILRGTYLRRMKSRVLDLPPIRWETVVVGRASTTLREMEMRESIGLDGEREEVPNERWRRLCGMEKASLVADLLVSEMEPSAHKVIVSAVHLDVLDVLEKQLRKFGVLRIDGSVPAAERDARVQEFQHGRGRVALLQIVAGGVGITLTAASEVVFAETSFVPGEVAQLADRCYRIGQTESVRVRLAALTDSVDERAMDVLRNKSRMIGQTLASEPDRRKQQK